MAMAAPSRVPSACTAVGPATTSAASVSASLDSPEPSATKVVSPGQAWAGEVRHPGKEVAGRRGLGILILRGDSSLLSGLGPALLRTGQHRA